MDREPWYDPKNYREMSVPHESAAAAEAAADAFLQGVKELRQKHRMQDVHVCAAVTIAYADGQEGTSMVECHFGDVMRAEAMLAHALGSAATARRELVSKFLEGKATRKR